MNKISINGPLLSIISYCFASISMTIINKYIVSGEHFNMNLLLLSIQSIVCILTVYILKLLGFINYKDFNLVDIKNWFPVSFSLVLVIYTGSKSLQFLSIPIYTIFKNLTIILIAYGELLWFNNKITRLTSFAFLLMVLSSVVAAYDDFNLNDLFNKSMIGYFWMALNCLSSAAYVSYFFMKIDTVINKLFKGFINEKKNQAYRFQRLGFNGVRFANCSFFITLTAFIVSIMLSLYHY